MHLKGCTSKANPAHGNCMGRGSNNPCLCKELLDAPGAVQVHEALVAFVDQAGAEGREAQLRHGAVVQHLHRGGEHIVPARQVHASHACAIIRTGSADRHTRCLHKERTGRPASWHPVGPSALECGSSAACLAHHRSRRGCTYTQAATWAVPGFTPTWPQFTLTQANTTPTKSMRQQRTHRK